MKAFVFNRDISSQGGSSRVCLAVIEALKRRGFDVHLITKLPVDWKALSKWNGGEVEAKVISAEPFSASLFGKYQRFLTFLPLMSRRHDLFVNTSGDFFPFLVSPRAPNITYCHFPVVRRISESDVPKKYRSGLWRGYYKPYTEILNRLIREAGSRSFFLTNSEYSRESIRRYLGLEARVLYPPVDIERFQPIAMIPRDKKRVATITRFDPSKQIEIILEILDAMPQKIEWSVIGTVNDRNRKYFEDLERRSRGVITLHPNATRSEVLEVLARSSVYFHPTKREHFGIAIVEAMAAGLIPVTWNTGGCSEFVPRRWQFANLEEARERIQEAMEATMAQVREVQELAATFSRARFEEGIIGVVERLLSRDWSGLAEPTSTTMPTTIARK